MSQPSYPPVAAAPTSRIVFDPTPLDIILGRGVPISKYKGNVAFRELIKTRKADYMGTGRHNIKQQIAAQVFAVIQERQCRFLSRIETDEEALEHGLPAGTKAWLVASHDVALTKVKQALREMESSMRKEENGTPKRRRKRSNEAAPSDSKRAKIQKTAQAADALDVNETQADTKRAPVGANDTNDTHHEAVLTHAAIPPSAPPNGTIPPVIQNSLPLALPPSQPPMQALVQAQPQMQALVQVQPPMQALVQPQSLYPSPSRLLPPAPQPQNHTVFSVAANPLHSVAQPVNPLLSPVLPVAATSLFPSVASTPVTSPFMPQAWVPPVQAQMAATAAAPVHPPQSLLHAWAQQQPSPPVTQHLLSQLMGLQAPQPQQSFLPANLQPQAAPAMLQAPLMLPAAMSPLLMNQNLTANSENTQMLAFLLAQQQQQLQTAQQNHAVQAAQQQQLGLQQQQFDLYQQQQQQFDMYQQQQQQLQASNALRAAQQQLALQQQQLEQQRVQQAQKQEQLDQAQALLASQAAAAQTSRATGHAWLTFLRHQKAAALAASHPTHTTAELGHAGESLGHDETAPARDNVTREPNDGEDDHKPRARTNDESDSTSESSQSTSSASDKKANRSKRSTE